MESTSKLENTMTKDKQQIVDLLVKVHELWHKLDEDYGIDEAVVAIVGKDTDTTFPSHIHEGLARAFKK
ncbi:MAG TPA: hypothetical protein VFQ43_14545 [Nitrososphaera sp.]|nr:hypothetical protein [Nitrososphaera sp.]